MAAGRPSLGQIDATSWPEGKIGIWERPSTEGVQMHEKWGSLQSEKPVSVQLSAVTRKKDDTGDRE